MTDDLATPVFVGDDNTGHIHPWARIGGEPQHKDWTGGLGVAPQIDRSARISAFCSVDAGTIQRTVIGARTWMLQYAHVGHDSVIGDDVVIGHGNIICGHVQIRDGAKLGVGVIVLPYRVIGEGAEIGAGAVVTKDIPAGECWVGNPAKRVLREERDPRPFSERRSTEVHPLQ